MVQLFGVENPTQLIAASNPSMEQPGVCIKGGTLDGPKALVNTMQNYPKAKSRQLYFAKKNSLRLVRIALQISRVASLVTQIQMWGIDVWPVPRNLLAHSR